MAQSNLVTVRLLDADRKTADGRIYPRALLESIAADSAHMYTIEEMSPIERELKKVPVAESWPEHAMAVSKRCYMEGDTLVMEFSPKRNKYGKLLRSTIESSGDRVRYFPVGYGNVAADGTVTDYTLNYVSFEILK